MMDFSLSAQNNGGALYLEEFGIASISGRMSNNHAGKDGGAVAAVGQSMVLFKSGLLLSNNSAGRRAGAALFSGVGAISGDPKACVIADQVSVIRLFACVCNFYAIVWVWFCARFDKVSINHNRHTSSHF